MAKDTKKSKRRKPQIIKVPTNCPFCKGDVEPTYKDHKTLYKFITDRAKMIGKARSGVCSKHQRRLAVAIKRARHLGLLPFTPSL